MSVHNEIQRGCPLFGGSVIIGFTVQALLFTHLFSLLLFSTTISYSTTADLFEDPIWQYQYTGKNRNTLLETRSIATRRCYRGSYPSHHREDATKINLQIFQKWIQGKGKLPVEWSTLIEALKDIGLVQLANEIEQNLK